MNKDELKQLVECLYLLEEFFEGEMDKAILWMVTENPFLGESKPINLFWRSRGHKVLSFIKSSLDENKL